MPNLSLTQRIGLLISHLRNAGSLLWKWEASIKGVTLGRQITFAGRPIISVARDSSLILRDRVSLNNSLRSNPVGCFQPCILRTLAQGAILELGERTGLSGAVVVAGKEIRIGEGTQVGAGAMIIDNDFHAPVGEWDWSYDTTTHAKPIRIGRGCFIGARAIILKGVTIGDRAIVGAGAVVAKDVPPGHRAVGNPARIIPP
ncbi:MAG: acyltransferase [Verrucomicrobia bacterium]|nr:acyltransferase [Verrucomicrobiota bacterium]